MESEATSFTVRQLDPEKTYALVRDGQVLGEVNKKTSLALPSTKWQADGSLVISTRLTEPQSFILKAMAATVAAR